MGWTDERIEVLRKLWVEGLSASQIATTLGGVSRNAVIGKIHRLGLSGRVKAPQARAARQRAAIAPGRRAATAQRVVTAGALAVKVVEEVEPVGEAEIVPFGPVLPFMELSATTCRWPVGDPAEDGFGFCGARTAPGETYCRCHAAVAYPARRKAR